MLEVVGRGDALRRPSPLSVRLSPTSSAWNRSSSETYSTRSSSRRRGDRDGRRVGASPRNRKPGEGRDRTVESKKRARMISYRERRRVRRRRIDRSADCNATRGGSAERKRIKSVRTVRRCVAFSASLRRLLRLTQQPSLRLPTSPLTRARAHPRRHPRGAPPRRAPRTTPARRRRIRN